MNSVYINGGNLLSQVHPTQYRQNGGINKQQWQTPVRRPILPFERVSSSSKGFKSTRTLPKSRSETVERPRCVFTALLLPLQIPCCRKRRCGYFSYSPLCATLSALGAILLLTGLVALPVVFLRSHDQQTTSTSKSITFYILNQHCTVCFSGIHNFKYVICQ